MLTTIPRRHALPLPDRTTMQLRVAVEMGAVEDSRRVVAFRNLEAGSSLQLAIVEATQDMNLRASRTKAPERNIGTWYMCQGTDVKRLNREFRCKLT